jgi:hypothetical protein
MGPFDLSTWGTAADPIIHIAIGILFGFILERAGFGSAKKLTAQFYLYDLAVLKVMFTGIITAMLLIYWTVGFGFLDFDKLWVNPTYLSSGILGGMLFGVGFLVGGYCPGTALVGIATLKLDAIFFLGGVLGGITVFGFCLPLFDSFWNYSGAKGALTLFDWLGVTPATAVMLAVVMALGMFIGGEAVERYMGRRTSKGATP